MENCEKFSENWKIGNPIIQLFAPSCHDYHCLNAMHTYNIVNWTHIKVVINFNFCCCCCRSCYCYCCCAVSEHFRYPGIRLLCADVSCNFIRTFSVCCLRFTCAVDAVNILFTVKLKYFFFKKPRNCTKKRHFSVVHCNNQKQKPNVDKKNHNKTMFSIYIYINSQVFNNKQQKKWNVDRKIRFYNGNQSNPIQCIILHRSIRSLRQTIASF